MIRQIIANFSVKARIVFILSLGIFGIGIFSSIVALSNHFSVVVPRYGGTYTEGIIGSPRFINPLLAVSDADRDLTSLVYSGLVRLGEDGEIIPDLAASWEISSDGKTYTVHLKDNLSFHDRKPLTAKDVLFTVSKINSSALKSSLRVAWDGVTTTAPDDQTVVFSLKKPYSGFLNQLTLGILPEHIWKTIPDESWALSNYNTEAIGSGPYRIRGISRDRIGIPESYTLTSFHRFTLGRPFISKIILVSIPNKDDGYKALMRGAIDGISGIDSKTLGRSVPDAVTTIHTPSPRVFGIFFNPSKNKIFSDPVVIRALNLVVDKSELISSVFNDYATPLNGPLPQSHDTQTSDAEERKALAIKLLDNAGWKVNPETGIREKMIGKEKLVLTFSLTTTNTGDLESSARILADRYTSIGIAVDIKVFEIGTLNEQIIRTRDFQALLFGQVIRHDTDMYAFWHSSQKADPGLNITGYTNKRVDTLLESAIRETSPSARAETYTTITQELAKDAPVVFLYTPDFIYLITPRVHHTVIPPITGAHDRFSLIYQWYLRTDHVWKGLVKE